MAHEAFCLNPLHPGPCRGPRRRDRPAPNRTAGRASVPAKAAPPAPAKKVAGRAAVPATPPAKKAAPAKAAPRGVAAPRGNNTPANRAASDAGAVAQILMGSTGHVDERFVNGLMDRVRAAAQRDQQTGAGGPDSDYSRTITAEALAMGRVMANAQGGTPQERRALAGRIANVVSAAMRTGDIVPVRNLRRELAGARTASAARQGEALALFGLRMVAGMGLWADEVPAFVSPSSSLVHLECNLSTFCRNPLHPGPCKGWKGTLAKVAPGTLKLIEEERKKKLAAKQAAKAAAQAKAKKIVDKAKRGEEVDAHPNAKKKLAKKATEQILGTDEEKITAIEGSTKLTQKEIAWHAQKKAQALMEANLAAGNLQGSKAAQQKYKAWARGQIAAALKADNESGMTGPDSEYQKTIAKLSGALSIGHADQHVSPQNEKGDELHAAVADAFDAAIQEDLKTGKVGHGPVNMKKLTKALKDIEGEPGDPVHDAAVGKAVGYDVEPEELTDKPVVLPGALTEEEADKLAAGAKQVALITGSPESAEAGAANAKKLSQLEGFTDKQTAMVMKTATNQASVAAAQQSDGLDGFSPQGKKKFEKVLAAEMVEMLETGGAPGPGSLAELVAMKKAGLLTAAEFHEQVQKKLKIKSKKLSAAKTPNAPAKDAAGGGAGAGGLTQSEAVGIALNDLGQIIEPGKPNSGFMVAGILADPNTSEEDKLAGAKSHAQGMAKTLMFSLPTATLTPDEKQAVHEVVAGIVEATMGDPKHGPAAKNLIKNLKAMSPSALKGFAAGMVPSAPGSSSAPSAKKSSTIANATKAKAALDRELGASQSSADYNAGSLGNNLSDFDDEQDHADILDNEADMMAKAAMKSADKAAMTTAEANKVQANIKAKIKKALMTGDDADVAVAKKAVGDAKTMMGHQLVAYHGGDAPSVPAPPPAPAAAPAGYPKPLASAVDNLQAASIIAAQAQAAYEKLIPGADGSALSSSSAIANLAQTLDNGQTPGEAAQKAAKALANAYLKKKLGSFKSSMPLLHEAALTDALAAEIEEGLVTGKFPEGGLLDKMSNPKFGFVKLKIAAKKEFDKSGGLPKKPLMGGPVLPTSSKQQALDDALDDAFGPAPGPGAPKGPPATVPDGLMKAAMAADNFSPLLTKLGSDYEAAMVSATTAEEKDASVNAMGAALAGAQMFSALSELDVSYVELDKQFVIDMQQKLMKDFSDALAAGADTPGGLAGMMAQIVADVEQHAKAVQKANGFADGSAALNDYKKTLFEAKAKQAMGNSTPATTKAGGGAGAGGTGTGVNPAAGAVTATPSASPVAVVTPVPPGKPLPALSPAGPAPDFKTFKKKGGQKGSNPGGTYEDANGTEHYVKQQKSPEHARNEAMASALYRAGGIQVPPIHIGEGAEGLTGTQTSSQIVQGAVPFNPKNPAHVAAARRGFAMDAFLGNWDAVGLSSDNIVIGPDGTAHRIDVGGSLLYRAQGSPKGAKFGDTVGEWNTLRDPSVNPSAAKVFGGMSDQELIQSLEQVEALTPDRIRAIVKAQGGDEAMAKKLIARREDLMAKLKELREAPPKLPGESNLKPADIKLAGTKKKQKIMAPKDGYPIAQVVLEGRENDVDEYNAKVAASKNVKDAATPPTPQMTDLPAGSKGRKSVKYYTTNAGYDSMNGQLRKNKGKLSSGATAEHIANVDAVMENSRLTEPITTVRGFRGGAHVFGELWTDRRDQNWAGAEFVDHAYSSSSVNMSTARGFAGAPGPNSVVLRIHMPAGTRALNLGQGSAYTHEAEILLNRGARFRIVADNGYQNGARHLDVEVMCDGEGCADAT